LSDLTVRMDGRIERICEHGARHPVGHIDPARAAVYNHDCDGCCKEYEKGLTKVDLEKRTEGLKG
jgi:hypothetical protein